MFSFNTLDLERKQGIGQVLNQFVSRGNWKHNWEHKKGMNFGIVSAIFLEEDHRIFVEKR